MCQVRNVFLTQCVSSYVLCAARPSLCSTFDTQYTTLAIVSPPQIEQRTYTMDCTELATEKTACRASNETQTTWARPVFRVGYGQGTSAVTNRFPQIPSDFVVNLYHIDIVDTIF
jgi:hypothetical protein